MKEREQRIKQYFDCWINKDISILRTIFAPDILYSESYGPEYHGIAIVEQWFKDWTSRGTVLQWTIKQFIHQGNMTAVEWYFKYEHDGTADAFDGVSLIEFNAENLIVSLKEFQSKLPHYYPYT